MGSGSSSGRTVKVKKKRRRVSHGLRSSKNLDHFKKRNIRIMALLAGAALVLIFVVLIFVQIVVPAFTENKVVEGSSGTTHTISDALDKGLNRMSGEGN